MTSILSVLCNLIACFLIISCSKTSLVRDYSRSEFFASYYFPREKTLFLFYDIQLPDSLLAEGFLEIEVDGEWKKVTDLKNVYHHERAVCQSEHRCGSASVFLDQAAKKKLSYNRIRVRYHEDSFDQEIFRTYAVTVENQLSYQVYGFFNEDHSKVGWTYRHFFPGMSHEKVHKMGLRRYFDPVAFAPALPGDAIDRKNPWMFNHQRCPVKNSSLELFIQNKNKSRNTFINYEQSIFWHKRPSSLFYEDDALCGTFYLDLPHGENYDLVHTAMARKNPLIEPAMPSLSLNIQKNQPFYVQIGHCAKEKTDPSYLSFQRKRLGSDQQDFDICLESLPTLSAEEVAGIILNKFKAAFLKNPLKDHLLMLLVHRLAQDQEAMDTKKILAALALIGYEHGMKLSPRISGAFVYDSHPLLGGVPDPMRSYVSWCPQTDPRQIIDGCSVFEASIFKKGMFTFSFLPIFPSIKGYKDYKKENGNKEPKDAHLTDILSNYRTDGTMVSQTALNSFATFEPVNKIFVSSQESISYCSLHDPYGMLVYQLEDAGLSLQTIEDKPSPVFGLADAHATRNKSAGYYLGLSWNQAFLLNYYYKATLDIKVSILPFSFSRNSDLFFGDKLWQKKEMDLSKALSICKKHCQNPFFTAEGRYHVTENWSSYHRQRCYDPSIPKP